MAYMNQEKKQVIKANLDKVLKPLGIKYSLRVANYMSIDCTIRSGPVDFLNNYNQTAGKESKYIQVNQFWYPEHFTGEAKEIVGKVIDALKSADYYDKSDSMVDYFDCAYYIHLNIGSWDREYQLTEPERIAA
jgi:hypothetical protein